MNNHGEVDEHLRPGEGLVDFKGIFAFLQHQQLHPVVTLEPHHQGGMETGFNYLEQQQFPYWLFS